MNPKEISSPTDLRRALDERRLSHGEALLVLLHRIDTTSVEEWVDALPTSIRADFAALARSRATVARTFETGRGMMLAEAPDVENALRAWLIIHDVPYQRMFYGTRSPTRVPEQTPNAKGSVELPGLVATAAAA